MAWASLCSFDELEEGKGKYVEIDGFKLAVFLNGGEVSVLDNTCPHAGASLASGYIDEGCAVCPLHFWAFQLKTGELRGSPGVAVTSYKVRLFPHDGRSFVQVDLPRF